MSTLKDLIEEEKRIKTLLEEERRKVAEYLSNKRKETDDNLKIYEQELTQKIRMEVEQAEKDYREQLELKIDRLKSIEQSLSNFDEKSLIELASKYYRLIIKV